MKYYRLLAITVIAFFSSMAMGDTLSLVGGSSDNFSIGWWGEAWAGEHWCGDTLSLDLSPDTVVMPPDTILDMTVVISDTTKITRQTTTSDSFIITTTTILNRTVLRDSADDPVVDIVNASTVITDSILFVPCAEANFISDVGGAAEGARYFDFYYKFRNYYAQLPFVWKGWGGYDSVIISPYTQLLVTYKGLLPEHQVQINFFYATWGTNIDTMSNFLKLGDGVGTLPPSPDEWKTVLITIPDSVYLPHITGITFSVENIPGGDGADTSGVGNFKVQEISLISPDIGTVRPVVSRGMRQDRYHFSPRTAGDVRVSVYSLSGVLLRTVTVHVDPSQRYSVRQLARRGGEVSEQIRIVKVRGTGVNLSAKIR